jgi:hypothetical protein
MARIIDIAIKILMIGGFFGLLLGLSLVLELAFIR